MNFLTPLYLAGIAAVTLPILFHMIRRAPRGRVEFSTLMFLEETPPTVTRRRRIEHWLLLLLRGLIVTLLAIAFARPFLRSADLGAADAGGRRIVVLIDRSASMRRDGAWDAALKRARRVVDDADADEQVALITFDRTTETVLGFEQWKSLPSSSRKATLKTRLTSLSPGWGATDLGRALADAVAACREETGAAPRGTELVLISDFQQGSRLEGLQQLTWPQDVNVRIERVEASGSTNAGLQWVGSGSPARESAPRVRVSNAADSRRSGFRVAWESADRGRRSRAVTVPPGESRVVRLPESAADSRRIVLEGDDHSYDNTVYRTNPEPKRMTVVYFGDDPPTDQTTTRHFLDRAFPDDRLRRVEVLTQDAGAPPIQAQNADVGLVVVGIELPDSHCNALHKYAEAGGRVVVLLESDSLQETLRRISGRDDLAVSETIAGDYTMLSDIDFEHAFFRMFNNPKYSDFTDVRFWTHCEVSYRATGSESVIARFEDGSPGVLACEVGAGTVVAFASGWDLESSNFALSTKFVPFVNGLLEGAVRAPEKATRLKVGDALPLEPSETDRTIRLPNASEIQLVSGARSFSNTTQPGTYELVDGGERARFSVNLDPRESETAALDPQELIARGALLAEEAGDVESPTVVQRRQLRERELESRQRLWQWLLLAVLALVVVETWLSGRVLKRAEVQG